MAEAVAAIYIAGAIMFLRVNWRAPGMLTQSSIEQGTFESNYAWIFFLVTWMTVLLGAMLWPIAFLRGGFTGFLTPPTKEETDEAIRDAHEEN